MVTSLQSVCACAECSLLKYQAEAAVHSQGVVQDTSFKPQPTQCPVSFPTLQTKPSRRSVALPRIPRKVNLEPIRRPLSPIASLRTTGNLLPTSLILSRTSLISLRQFNNSIRRLLWCRTLQNPLLTIPCRSSVTQIQKIITSQKGISIDLDNLGRDLHSHSKELYLWGQSEADDSKDGWFSPFSSVLILA